MTETFRVDPLTSIRRQPDSLALWRLDDTYSVMQDRGSVTIVKGRSVHLHGQLIRCPLERGKDDRPEPEHYYTERNRKFRTRSCDNTTTRGSIVDGFSASCHALETESLTDPIGMNHRHRIRKDPRSITRTINFMGFVQQMSETRVITCDRRLALPMA